MIEAGRGARDDQAGRHAVVHVTSIQRRMPLVDATLVLTPPQASRNAAPVAVRASTTNPAGDQFLRPVRTDGAAYPANVEKVHWLPSGSASVNSRAG